MAEESMEVGVVVAKRKLKGPWASHMWLPRAILPAAPAMAPWTRLAGEEAEETFFAGPVVISLHSGDTSHYRDNLVSGRPSLWVALRPVAGDDHEVAGITADPYEGEGMTEVTGDVVEAVPMPSEVRDWVAQFVERYHVERPFVKRKRDRAHPETLAQRGPGMNRREDEG